MNTILTISSGWILRSFLLILLFLATVTISVAQTEDTTRTEQQELQEEQLRENTIDESETPYQMDVLESDINRYELRDYGSRSRFYRQLDLSLIHI